VCASRFRSPAVLKMLEYYIGARGHHTRALLQHATQTKLLCT
jgi:hypothetical protein